MPKLRLKPETQAALFDAGLKVLSLYQLPQGQRRLAEPSDPWVAALHNSATALTATKMLHGLAATPDGAVWAALDSVTRLEIEIDNLLATLRALR